MTARSILVVSSRADLLGSLVFALEAEGYRVDGRSDLPEPDWMRQRHFDACVVDQQVLDARPAAHIEAIAFCLSAHPVILVAERPGPPPYDWVSQVVTMPDNAGSLTAALRNLLLSSGSQASLS